MGKKKTVFVWVLLAVLLSDMVIGIIEIIPSLIYIKMLLLTNAIINLIILFLQIIALVIIGIFLTKLYNVRSDVIKWAHINFGYSIFGIVVVSLFLLRDLLPEFISSSKTDIQLDLIASLIVYIFFLIFYIFMWIGVAMHLKRAKREKLMDFS